MDGNTEAAARVLIVLVFGLLLIFGLVRGWIWLKAIVNWRQSYSDDVIEQYQQVMRLIQIARWAPLLPPPFRRPGRYLAIRALRQLHWISHHREFHALVLERVDPMSPTRRRYQLVLDERA